MFKYAIFASVCCLMFGANAATMLLKDYKAPKSAEFKEFNELYLSGVKEGLLTSNAKLAADDKPKMFCLPPNKEVTAKEADEIIMQQADAVPDADNYPISILLLAGLADTFPCDEQRSRVRAHRRAVEPTHQSEPERKKRFKRGAAKSTAEKHH